MARGISPQEATLDQVADSIIQLFAFSPAQARNAYSAVLLIPGFGGVRFHPLLNAYKKLWNRNLEKYGSFWDPLPILLRLARTDYASLGVIVPPVWLGLRPPPSPISALRTHLIICCRLLCLYRSSDLANIKRVVSVMGHVPYIKIRRKGQRVFKWERVVSLDFSPQISPFHLIQKYVALTRGQVCPGGPLLLTLKPPFKGLSADAVGSVTRGALEFFGVPSSVWGPHSTRGAGVGLMKKLGLSAEEVCEIGQWKGVQAFVAHYQRLGAQETLQENLAALVHSRTSLGRSAEPEVSRTPPRQTDRGGRDTEGAAQRPSEPTRPPRKRSRSAGVGVGCQGGRETPPPEPERQRRRRGNSANSGKSQTLRDPDS